MIVERIPLTDLNRANRFNTTQTNANWMTADKYINYQTKHIKLWSNQYSRSVLSRCSHRFGKENNVFIWNNLYKSSMPKLDY